MQELDINDPLGNVTHACYEKHLTDFIFDDGAAAVKLPATETTIDLCAQLTLNCSVPEFTPDSVQKYRSDCNCDV